MSLGHIGLIILSIILFLTGFLIIRLSKIFIDWLFDWSARMLKGSQDTPYTQGEHRVNLWTIRVMGVLFIFAGVLPLYIVFSDFHR
jgi:uncharacterized membrane protein